MGNLKGDINMENENTNTTVDTTEAKDAGAETTATTFTEEELNKRIQSETDKVRTEYSKKVKDLESKVKELTPVEKTQAELDMEARIKALEDKEKEVQQKEKLLNITNKLQEQGLPSELAKYMQGAENVETELNSLKDIFSNYTQNALNNTYKPKQHKSKDTTISKEDFAKMNYIQRQKLYTENKELYLKLSK